MTAPSSSTSAEELRCPFDWKLMPVHPVPPPQKVVSPISFTPGARNAKAII